MSHKFQCSRCSHDLVVLTLDVGKFAECPKCKEWNEVPAILETSEDILNCIIKKKEHVQDIIKREEELLKAKEASLKREKEEKKEEEINNAIHDQPDKAEDSTGLQNKQDQTSVEEETHVKPEQSKNTESPFFTETSETYSPRDNIRISFTPQDGEIIITLRELLKKITPRVYGTPFLIILNSLIFILMGFSGISLFTPDLAQLIPWGIRYSILILENGEWWRFFTSMFVHTGLIHLIINMVVLGIAGNILERLYGTVAFILIYIVSGLFGSVFGFIINAFSISAGASSAIMGIIGSLIPFIVNKELGLPGKFIQRTIVIILILSGLSILFSSYVSYVDSIGNIAGFLTGMGIGFILRRTFPGPKEEERKTKYIGISGLGVLILIIGVLGGNFLLKPIAPILKINEHWRNQEYERALGVLAENPGILSTIPEGIKYEAIIYGNAGWENYLDGDYTRCIELSEKAYSIDPVIALYARYNVALSYLRLGFIEKSKTLYKELEDSDYKIQGENRTGAIKDLMDLIEKGIYSDEARYILMEIFGLEDIDA